jgi:hypothetical protein
MAVYMKVLRVEPILSLFVVVSQAIGVIFERRPPCLYSDCREAPGKTAIVCIF